MCLLKVENDTFKFEVSLLGQAFNEYPNQFSVAAYAAKHLNKHESQADKLMTLTITDKVHYFDISYSYQFTEKQMPFMWQSYGNDLSVSVNATLNSQPFFMWIIVNAIFEAKSLSTYVALPALLPLAENCLKNNQYSTGGKYCFSVHTNFTGSWYESTEVCKGKGGELWNVNNKFIWNHVMRSSKSEWYLEKDRQERPIEYDGGIDASSLLHLSSVMFLKYPECDQQVKKTFSLCFCQYFSCN